MSHSNSNRQKRLYALGGVVFGASAVAAVVASYNILIRDEGNTSSSTLRGSSSLPNANSGTDTTLGKSTQLQKQSNFTFTAPSTEVVYKVISQNSTSISTHFVGDRNSNDVAELISTIEAASLEGNLFSASMSKAATGSSMYPTYSPTTLEDIPTFSPTRFSDDLPKALPIKRSNENGFRLKMYWEEGYYWQENPNERFWCMSCQDNSCVSGAKLDLRDCEERNDTLDALFVAVPYGDAGHQFRVAATDLCLMKMGRGRAIKLKNCRNPKNRHFPLQLFKGLKHDDKFDLRPSTDTNRCLSQHHHPKCEFIQSSIQSFVLPELTSICALRAFDCSKGDHLCREVHKGSPSRYWLLGQVLIV